MGRSKRLVLLGDSIFDNGAYVQPGEPDVAAHLRARLTTAETASTRGGFHLFPA